MTIINSKVFGMTPVPGNSKNKIISMNSLFNMNPIQVLPIDDLLALFDFIVIAGVLETFDSATKKKLCEFLSAGKSLLWINDAGFDESFETSTCSGINSLAYIPDVVGFDPESGQTAHPIFDGITPPAAKIDWVEKSAINDYYTYGKDDACDHNDLYYYLLQKDSPYTIKVFNFDPETEIQTPVITFPSTDPIDDKTYRYSNMASFYVEAEEENRLFICRQFVVGVINPMIEILMADDIEGTSWSVVFTFPPFTPTYPTPYAGWYAGKHLAISPDGNTLLCFAVRYDQVLLNPEPPVEYAGEHKIFCWTSTDGTTWNKKGGLIKNPGNVLMYMVADDIRGSCVSGSKLIVSLEFTHLTVDYPAIFETSDDGVTLTITWGNTYDGQPTDVYYLPGKIRNIDGNLLWLSSKYYVGEATTKIRYWNGSTWINTFTYGPRVGSRWDSKIDIGKFHDDNLYLILPQRTATSINNFLCLKTSNMTGAGMSYDSKIELDLIPHSVYSAWLRIINEHLYAFYSCERTAPVFNGMVIKRGDLYKTIYGDTIRGITSTTNTIMAQRLNYQDYGDVTFVTTDNNDMDGRYLTIADSNMFTNAAPSYNKGKNTDFMHNIFKWLGEYEDTTVSRKRLLWLTGLWETSQLKENWMNLNSVNTWGCSSLKTYLQSIGFTITQVTNNINSRLKNIA